MITAQQSKAQLSSAMASFSMLSGGGISISNSVLVVPPRPPLVVHSQSTTKSLSRRFFFSINNNNIFSSSSSSSRACWIIGKKKEGRGLIKCQAVGDNTPPPSPPPPPPTDVYQGVYGPWTIDSTDVREVILYRSGLVTAALSFVVAASTPFLPPELSSDLIKGNLLDLFYTIGAAGLGLSLFLIHIYVTEIKLTLQALWALGVLGSLATYATLARPSGHGLIEYVALHNPTSLWFVGPLFAALTGLVFKEGLCYGKLEAGILTFIVPSLLLGHLTGLMDDGVKVSLLGVWMALFVVFAGRKFTQPIKDDIGDKSVFMFKAMPEEEKNALIEKLQLQQK